MEDYFAKVMTGGGWGKFLFVNVDSSKEREKETARKGIIDLFTFT